MEDRPQRRSIRLPGFDYSQSGAYFVTVCIQDRCCLFGDVVNGAVEASVAGLMVESWWGQITNKFPDVALDAFVVMPNHVHGILVLGGTPTSWNAGQTHRFAPTNGGHPMVGADLRVRPPFPPAAVPSPALSRVIQWFKTMTTNDYILGVREFGFPQFNRRLWQRNYYEHIVRSDDDLARIRAYIEANPARWDEDDENPARVIRPAPPAAGG
jgi:REP element-mobilizing transposase RayT